MPLTHRRVAAATLRSSRWAPAPRRPSPVRRLRPLPAPRLRSPQLSPGSPPTSASASTWGTRLTGAGPSRCSGSTPSSANGSRRSWLACMPTVRSARPSWSGSRACACRRPATSSWSPDCSPTRRASRRSATVRCERGFRSWTGRTATLATPMSCSLATLRGRHPSSLEIRPSRSRSSTSADEGRVGLREPRTRPSDEF
jgi:hypothetical protein